MRSSKSDCLPLALLELTADIALATVSRARRVVHATRALQLGMPPGDSVALAPDQLAAAVLAVKLTPAVVGRTNDQCFLFSTWGENRRTFSILANFQQKLKTIGKQKFESLKFTDSPSFDNFETKTTKKP